MRHTVAAPGAARQSFARDCPKTPLAEHSLQKNTTYAELVRPFAYIFRYIDGFSDSPARSATQPAYAL